MPIWFVRIMRSEIENIWFGGFSRRIGIILILILVLIMDSNPVDIPVPAPVADLQPEYCNYTGDTTR